MSGLVPEGIMPMTDGFSLSIDGPDTLSSAILLLLLGLGLTGYGAYDYVQQSDTIRNAVEVEATITETDVVTEGSVSGQTGGKVQYEPRVEFTYEYQGVSYTGTNIFPTHIAPEYDQRSKAESVISEYETGTTVTAYVDPNDPSDAFLKNKTSDTSLVAAGIGGVISLLGGASVWKKHRTN